MPIELKSEKELDGMRAAGRINGEVRAILMKAIEPGITGKELDDLATFEIEKRGGIVTFRGYAPGGKPPFPGAICYSVNEELVHGIPGDRSLEAGDIVSIDMGVTYNGWVSDAAFTSAVGEVSDAANALINTTRQALLCGIESARIGNRLGEGGGKSGATALGALIGSEVVRNEKAEANENFVEKEVCRVQKVDLGEFQALVLV